MSSIPKQLLVCCYGLLPERLQSALRRVHYRRKLTRARLSDEPDLAAIALLTKPGDTVFDLGANFGLFTRFLSESVGGSGRVFSFEPTADMFSVLSNNCSHLGLANTSVHRTALSDRTGTSEMVIPVRNDGSLNHYEASLAGADQGGTDGKKITVETSTLDDFCSHHGIGKIDFIKCDVEGHELEVLEGARNSLLHHRPTLLLEVNDPLDAGGHGSKVLKKIRELDYEVLTLQDGSLQAWEPGEVCVNYVLRPR
jgi:FkbM family methyltransferase